MKLLRKYIKEIVRETRGQKRLWVFDFDDTLVKTDAMTHVTTSEGKTFDLTPGEFAVYEKQPGDVCDYSDFQKLINPRSIRWTNKILHNVYEHHGSDAIVILSARSTAAPIEQFLKQSGLTGIEVVALDSANPLQKSEWINARIKRDGYDFIEFFDDSYKNVAAVHSLRESHPEVLIVARHIIHRRIASLHG